MFPNDLIARMTKFYRDLKQEGVLLPSIARTATTTSADVSVSSGTGLVVVLDVTAGSVLLLTLAIQRKDPASGKYVTILTSASVTGVSTNTYKVHPDLAAVANLTVNDVLAGTFRVVVTHGNATSCTYTVGYSIV